MLVKMADLDDSELPSRITFIKNEAPKLHPAFSFHGKYDKNTDEFVLADTPVDKQNLVSQIQLSDLRTAIQEFQQLYSGNDALSNIDLQNLTWDNVFAKLAEARDHYTAEEKRGIGYLKVLWQKTGRNADKIEPWLDFIPDEYGLNFVRAGIIIILKFAKRSAAYGARLQQAIIQVVDAVAQSVPKRSVQRKKKRLQSCIHDLYVLVLTAVAHIIKYLLHDTEKPFFKRTIPKVFQSSSRNQGSKPEAPKTTLDQIEKIVKNVQDQANRVDILYRNLMDETCVESFELQVETQEQLHLINENIYETRRTGDEIVQNSLPAILQRTEQIADGFDELRDIPKLLRILKETQEQSIKEFSEKTVQLIVSNMLNNLLRDKDPYIKGDDQRGRLMGALPYGSPRSLTPNPRSELLVTLSELLRILKVPPESPNHDLDVVMMEESWLKSENLTVAERLAQAPRFRNWLTAQGSGFLLVEGSDEEHATDSMSCMSFVCLTIIGKLIGARRPREVVIYCFCGLHCDQHEGPNFMIRSLVMQVLFALKSRQCLDLNFVSNEYFLRGLRNHQPSELLNTLAALLRQFPADTTIYCVLDGINSYEGGYPYSFKADMMFFIRELRDLTISHLDMHHYGLMRDRQYSSRQCSFKLLLTSSNTTDLCWDQIVHPGNRVSTGYMS
ncbi:hypothetical protein J3F84DRAFT_358599 [Trichoderma pleuroticola]